MTLICKEDLRKHFEKAFYDGTINSFSEVLDAVDDAPEAIVDKPRKWIVTDSKKHGEYYNRYTCPNCYNSFEAKNLDFIYCPYCGSENGDPSEVKQ